MESAADGKVLVSLAGLLDMRHHLHDLQLFSRPGRRSPLIGLHHSKLRGRGVDFDRVRVYLPGDDVRNIDWRITARTGEPHTKLFHEERERPVFLVVEQSPTLFFGSSLCFKSVLAARVAALFGWAALEHGDRIGGLVFRHDDCKVVRPRRSRKSLLQLLGLLVEANHQLPQLPLEEAADSGLALALRQARQILRPGSLLVLLCDERHLDAASEHQLGQLSGHCDLLLLPLSDPLDHALPVAGLLRFASDSSQCSLDSSDPAIRQAWREQAQARQSRWQQISRRLGALLLPLNTAQDPVASLRQQLQPAHHGKPA